jgi:hypothetical protein
VHHGNEQAIQCGMIDEETYGFHMCIHPFPWP